MIGTWACKGKVSMKADFFFSLMYSLWWQTERDRERDGQYNNRTGQVADRQAHDEPLQQFDKKCASYPAFWTNSNIAFRWAASFRPEMLYSITTVHNIKSAPDIPAAFALHTAVAAVPQSA